MFLTERACQRVGGYKQAPLLGGQVCALLFSRLMGIEAITVVRNVVTVKLYIYNSYYLRGSLSIL